MALSTVDTDESNNLPVPGTLFDNATRINPNIIEVPVIQIVDGNDHRSEKPDFVRGKRGKGLEDKSILEEGNKAKTAEKSKKF